MNNSPMFSVVVILNDFYHLANLTLTSIFNQIEKDFEIIVIETASSKKDLIMLRPYIDKIKVLKHSDEPSLAFLMNTALSFCNGKYVNFLFSGDTFISKFSLGYLRNFIKEKKYPDLICTSFLQRDDFSPPQAVNFTIDIFRKGNIYMNVQSCWFLLEVLNEFNEFDTKYKYQMVVDMISKIFMDKNRTIAFSNRVLVDHEIKKTPSSVLFIKAFENLKIVYKNFGLLKTIYWWIVHDHFRMFKLFFYSIKQAFWSP
ncbi:MAG: glycosyltransferase [Parachlamydiales bacterium]|jgi:glycosyltransferase involved in cell wall biosynthesis